MHEENRRGVDSILSLQTLQLAAVDGGVLELHCGLQRLRVGRQAGGRRRRDLPLPAKPPGHNSHNYLNFHH